MLNMGPPQRPPGSLSLLEYMATFESVDNQSWFLHLLNYPQLYQDTELGVQDLTGAKIVDKLILPNAGWEVALSFIQNILKVGEDGPLTDDWKKRGLEIGSKEEFKDKREELVRALYPAEKDYSKPLLTDAFHEELNQFRTCFGFMGNSSDARALKENDRDLFKLLLQDPLSTLECVLPLSLRTAQFRVLEQSFLAFKLKSKNMTRTFGEEALLLNLQQLQVDDRTWDSVHSLVTKGFFRFEALNEMLRLVTIDAIKEEDLERVEKLVQVYCGMVAELRTILAMETIEKSVGYLQFLVGFTRAGFRKSNSKVMLTIRDLCLAALAHIPGGTKYGIKFDPSWTEDKINMSIAYVRFPELRDRIGEEAAKMDWNFQELSEVVIYLLGNSSSLELPGCYEFYSKVLVPFHLDEKEASDFIDKITRTGMSVGIEPLTLLKFLTLHVQELQKNPAFETNVLGHVDLIETMAFIIVGKVNLLFEEIDKNEAEPFSLHKKQRLIKEDIDSKVPIVETLQEILEFVGWIEERYDSKSGTEETDPKTPIQIAYKDAIEMLEQIPKAIQGFWRNNSYQAHLTIIIKKLGGEVDKDSTTTIIGREDDDEQGELEEGDEDGPYIEEINGDYEFSELLEEVERDVDDYESPSDEDSDYDY